MDPSNGKASHFERRSSVRHSLRLSTTNGPAAADDDDYDLSAMMVADGFRPSDQPNGAPIVPPSQSHIGNQAPSTPPTQQAQLYHTNSNTPSQLPPQLSSTSKVPTDMPPDMRPRPSSISKPPRSHDSLALRNDGSSTAAANQSHIAGMSGMSSDAPIMRIESPYQGPSGPSHPYQMYPQRTMSVATTSTTVAAATAAIPEDQSYNGPRGPTHPYALYTQNTVPSGEPAGQEIPVGFNNMGGTYQRQLGPDGEEAGDMIGPLGHMEELPPYTRYPENAIAAKTTTAVPAVPVLAIGAASTAVAAAAITPSTDPVPSSPDRTIAGAGGIGMATRDPEFSSTDDDLGMPRTRPSVRSNLSDASRHEVNTAARDMAEKPQMGKWEAWAKQKLWDTVPYWAICLLAVGLIIMGIILGAVVGTLLTRHKKPPSDDSSTSATVDITRLKSVPTDLTPAATGYYALPLWDENSQTSKTCFNGSSQLQTWTCNIPFASYAIDVEVNQNLTAPPVNGFQVFISPINATRAQFLWGTKPPPFDAPLPLTLVTDTYEPDRGPAWWTTFNYNKTVIISESSFSSSAKRGYDGDDGGDGPFPPPPRHGSGGSGAKEGDKPWICTWPDVTAEIFVYPNQNTSQYTTTTTTPSSTTATTTSAAYTTTSSSNKNQGLPSYPKVLKIVEQRYLSSKSQIASCRQVEIIDGGKSCKPVRDSDGNPIEVTIVENYPWSVKLEQTQRYRQIPKRWAVRELLARGSGSLELTDCGCLWWST